MKNNVLKFRKAVIADRTFLLELRKLSMTAHLAQAGLVLSDAQHMERIDEFFDDSFIICRGSTSIGLIKFGIVVDRIHIRQLQLLPKFHGLGIGGRVLDIIKKKATERNLPITLNVLLKNPALRLYQRHGFVIEGENELEFQMRWQIK